MATSNLSQPKVVSEQEWLAARKVFFLQEKAMTHALDELRAERRRLPWVKVEKPYVFEAPDGKRTLADLFQDRGQLAVYHFMLAPGSDHVCKGCSFVADHIDAARQHFGDADLSFAAISRAPIARIEQVKRALGWTFPWVSSHRSDFNYDFGVSFRQGGHRRRPRQLQLWHADQERRHDGHQHLCPRRPRRSLSHLFDLRPWDRKSDGHLHVARPHTQGSPPVR